MTSVIISKEQYQDFLNRVERLIDLDPDPNTPEFEQLQLLSKSVEEYEKRKFIFSKPTPIESIKFLFSIILISGWVFSTPLKADVSSWISGCLIMGGAGVGGAALAASTSSASYKNNQGMIVAGVTGCLVGGFISGKVERDAEMRASKEYKEANTRLRHKVYSVMHDLCVMKNTCGPDGVLYKDKKGVTSPEYQDMSDYKPLRSGN